MAYEWADAAVATLKVQRADKNEMITFNGVSTDPAAGKPQDFLNATNHLLDIAGLSAVIGGIQRTVKQEGVEE